MKNWVIGCLLLPFVSLAALEYAPWFPRAFEIDSELSYLFQQFQKLETGNSSTDYNSHDHFVTGRAGVAYMNDFDAQLELVCAATRAHSFTFDHVSVMGRYLLMDDVTGAPVSWTVGVTGTKAIRSALYDPGSFHHGLTEGEIHTAVGRECTRWDTWGSRWWVVAAIGCADVGSPWLRADGAVEFQMPMRNQFVRLFVHSLFGLGKKDLFLPDFHGYGPIHHKSVDLGIRVTHRFAYCGSLSLEYAYRVFAKNFPENANLFLVSYTYPFGL